MEKDFKLGQSNEVIKNQSIYDLHNQYDLLEITISAKKRELKMAFEPNAEFGIHKPPVVFIFSGINHLEFSKTFGGQVVSTLDEVGYKSPDDRDDNWLLSEEQATADDHLFFRMEGQNFIRIYCKKASLIELDEIS